MKRTALFILVLFIFCNADGQITKGNWQAGGNASFTAYSYSQGSGTNTKVIYSEIAPAIGYFFFDRFSAGLKLDMVFSHQKTYGAFGSYSTDANSLVLGPYARYYFLDDKKIANLFAEANYAYGIGLSKGGSNGQKLSFFAGSVIFFTPSVGLEFTVGYDYYPNSGLSIANNIFEMGLGFKIHLERGK